MDSDRIAPRNWTFGWILLLAGSLASAASHVETGSVAVRLASALRALLKQNPETCADFSVPLIIAGLVMAIARVVNRKREYPRLSRVFLITGVVIFGLNVLSLNVPSLFNAAITTIPVRVKASQSAREFADKCACPLKLAAVNDEMVLEQECLGFRFVVPVEEYEVLPPQVIMEYATNWVVKRRDESGTLVFMATSLNEYSESALQRYSNALLRKITERAGLEGSDSTSSSVGVTWTESEHSATVDLFASGLQYIARTLMEPGGRLNASWIVTVQCFGFDADSAREMVESLRITQQDKGS